MGPGLGGTDHLWAGRTRLLRRCPPLPTTKPLPTHSTWVSLSAPETGCGEEAGLWSWTLMLAWIPSLSPAPLTASALSSVRWEEEGGSLQLTSTADHLVKHPLRIPRCLARHAVADEDWSLGAAFLRDQAGKGQT